MSNRCAQQLQEGQQVQRLLGRAPTTSGSEATSRFLRGDGGADTDGNKSLQTNSGNLPLKMSLQFNMP